MGKAVPYLVLFAMGATCLGGIAMIVLLLSGSRF